MKSEKAILDSAVDAVVLLDESGTIVFANQSCERLLGQSSAHLSSRPATDLPLLAAALSAFQKCGQSLDRIPAGEMRIVEIESLAVPEGKCAVVVWSIQFGGGRMWLLMFRTATAHTAKSASIETATEPIIRELVAGAAHDFNNLCTVAVTTFDLTLEAASMSEVERRQIRDARKRMLHGAEGLKQLQAYIRRSESEFTLVSLAEAVELTVWAASCVFGPALQMKREMPVAEVLSCEVNRRELLLSLLGAVQMVAGRLDGRGEIVMRLARVSQRDAFTNAGAALGCLTLKGLHPPASTTRVRMAQRGRALAGAGVEQLALALAAWAETRGGRAGWSGGDATEATWNLVLPLFELDQDLTQEPVRARFSDASGPTGQQILVADDDSMVRALISATLRKEGLFVVEVNDGEEAVSRVVRDPDAFGLAVLDLHMPRLGGQGALERLRAIKPALKAIFLTGSVLAETIGFQADADVVRLQKPFAIEDLLRTVRQSLKV